MEEIIWHSNGWTIIQDADAATHTLEISCLAEDGEVIEIRKRHNDGEEEKLTRRIDSNHSLPMPIREFIDAFEKKEIVFK